MARETLVIELECEHAVGTDEAGSNKVKDHIIEQGRILNRPTLTEPRTHESPKYGLSGWGPLADGAAVHTYAWDHHDGEHPPFVSVDISTPQALTPEIQKQLIDSTASHFGARLHRVVHKTSNDPHAPSWKELASHIHRQRLAIDGQLKTEIPHNIISDYLVDLSRVLKMSQLSSPYFHDSDNNHGWMHWETSGAIVERYGKRFATDIYTCKPFDTQAAISFTRDKLRLSTLSYKEF